MLTIKISEFTEYSESGLKEYLDIQNETDFKIIIRKECNFPEYPKINIANEYHLVAYSFSLLADISTVFSYFIPSPYLKKAFFCIISTSNMGLMAETLFTIIKGLYFPDPVFFELFKDNMNQYFEKLKNDNKYCRTAGLLEIGNAFIPEPDL